LFTECESIDEQEKGTGSYVAMSKELAKTENLKVKIKQALDTFQENSTGKVNQTSVLI